MSEIHSTADMAEQEWDGESGPEDVATNMVATVEPEGKGIEFHVSMRDYTLRDMEALITEAAARMLIGSRSEDALKKQIETRCIETIADKADKVLAGVTAEIINQPLTPKFGDKKPVTMGEFLGLYGREYLTERVSRHNGKPTSENYSAISRIEYLVQRYMDERFEREINKATNAAINEVRAAVEKQHKEILEDQKRRFREALDRTIGSEAR